MPENIHDQIQRERNDALPPGDNKIQIYREYAEGKQVGTLSQDQWHALRGLVGHDHADNLCDTVLATGASRVEFEGFEVDDTAVASELENLTVRNQLLEMNFDLVYRVERDGNHTYGLTWKRDTTADAGAGRVVVAHEPWWNGKEGIFVHYDVDGRTALYAVKDFRVWMGDAGGKKRERRVIWFPDHIERFIRDGAGWIPFRLETDPAEGVIEWTKRDGSPLGIPIVHFANARFGKAPYGVSDLAGGVIGLQDDINDFQRDLSAAGRLTAYQMYWVTGHNVNKTPLQVGPGALIWSENSDASFGAFAAGSLDQIISGHGSKVSTVARNTATPQHLITGGDWPSGEALLRAETPLVDRAHRMIRSIGPQYGTLGHRAIEMINAFGRGALDEDKLIRAKFAPAERRDDLTLAQVDHEKLEALLILRDLGFSYAYIQAKYGLTPPEIARMVKERQAEMIAAGETIPLSDLPLNDPENDGAGA